MSIRDFSEKEKAQYYSEGVVIKQSETGEYIGYFNAVGELKESFKEGKGMANEKKKLNIDDVLQKVLKDKKTLTKEELKLLLDSIKRLKTEKETKKSEKEELSEVLERTMLISLCESALETVKVIERKAEKDAFKSLPLEEKHEKLLQKIEALENSSLRKSFRANEKEQSFSEFYEDYCKKYGRSMY